MLKGRCVLGLPVERLLKQEIQLEYKVHAASHEEEEEEEVQEVMPGTKRHRVDLGDRIEDFAQSAKRTQQDVLSVLKRGQTFRGTSLREQEHVHTQEGMCF